MANELKHGSVGTELTQAEWEAVGAHVVANQAVGDIIYASSTSQLRRLGISGTGTHILSISGGIPAWAAPAAAAAGTLTGSTLASGVTASSLTSVGTIATGVWQGTDVGVAYGGTGASTLTDGGVLLGSGTGAITAMTVLADGEFIVGDGTTDPVAESGATARASLGLGTAAVLALAQANQAAIEAETDENTYIPPDLVKNAPGVAKCWVNLNGTGTPAIRSSYNVTSISDVGVGRPGVTIATDFSSANYVIAGSVQDTLLDDNAVAIKGGGTQAAGSFEVRTTFDDAVTGIPAVYDMTFVYIVAFGDQ